MDRRAATSGTPAAWSGINPEEDPTPVTFTATRSTGTSIRITVDASAGKPPR